MVDLDSKSDVRELMRLHCCFSEIDNGDHMKWEMMMIGHPSREDVRTDKYN